MTTLASSKVSQNLLGADAVERLYVGGAWDSRNASSAEKQSIRLTESGDTLRIEVPAGSTGTFLERYVEGSSSAYATQRKTAIVLGENAGLTHYRVVCEGSKATHQSFVEVQMAGASAYESHVVLLSGAQVRDTIHVRMEGEGAECSLNGLYRASGEDSVEAHTLIDHVRPHGTSREFYKGILDGKARAIFDGLVVVRAEAQKTDSAQTNKNLLLSPEARANSNPELKIFANDVKCKHGSTIGQLNADALFYLRSRGVPMAEARRLLIYAFAAEMIGKIPSIPLQEWLSPLLFEQ